MEASAKFSSTLDTPLVGPFAVSKNTSNPFGVVSRPQNDHGASHGDSNQTVSSKTSLIHNLVASMKTEKENKQSFAQPISFFYGPRSSPGDLHGNPDRSSSFNNIPAPNSEFSNQRADMHTCLALGSTTNMMEGIQYSSTSEAYPSHSQLAAHINYVPPYHNSIARGGPFALPVYDQEIHPDHRFLLDPSNSQTYPASLDVLEATGYPVNYTNFLRLNSTSATIFSPLFPLTLLYKWLTLSSLTFCLLIFSHPRRDSIRRCQQSQKRFRPRNESTKTNAPTVPLAVPEYIEAKQRKLQLLH
ncbi:hypothetical protein GGU10DRAFT_348443 [Lentinula aff. detonsa]|uniref:Uncharacterized protein n=1 Tax=Lentinula aff. detonsa TaxID=2804958 RepID=A0AA38NQ03_9AGAR|nr:hypothetical protein GGU10DRAFT_348443 [Lentinula aff. detonsa]